MYLYTEKFYKWINLHVLNIKNLYKKPIKNISIVSL